MLEVGDPTPEFEAEATTGGTISRSGLLGSTYVLYFYPKSFTPGCTIETREFAKRAPEIEELGARVVGISVDRLKTQCKFADKLGADFPILADKGGEISKAFGVKRTILPLAKRVTYVVNEDGIIEAAFHMEKSFIEHVENVIEHLKSR